ncbi:MAG: efflux RND transporter periplasmic adaptor subunit [Pseudomonadota bacterium]
MRKLLAITQWVVKEAFWLAVAGGLIFGGWYGFQYLGENRVVTEAEPVERPVALVETVSLDPLDGALPIRGEGFVRPLRQLSLSSQVGGRVTYVHPAIHDRTRFEQGEVLVRLDDRAAAAALEQAQANIAATEARIAQNEKDVQRVSQLVDRGASTRTQLDELRSVGDELAANLSGFNAARLAAEIAQADRTIVAPFDGAVLSETVEVGDVVAVGQALAEIYTEGELEIDVPVRQADAALIPGLFEGAQSEATVDVPFADYVFRWQGYVTRVQPEVNASTRTLTVTVRLGDLENVEGRSVTGQTIASGAPPALINAYAQVVIRGADTDDAYSIPSTALRGGDTVWLYNSGKLQMTPADAIHVDGEDTYISAADLPVGSRIITSQLLAPLDGMPVRNVSDRRQADLNASDAAE